MSVVQSIVYTQADFLLATNFNTDQFDVLISQDSALAANYLGSSARLETSPPAIIDVTFFFSATLSEAEEAALTALVNAYTYISTIATTAIIEERYPIGTNAPSAFPYVWTPRAINSINDNVLFATVDAVAKAFTIHQSGRYIVTLSAPAYRVRAHQARLINITVESDPSPEVWNGTSEVSGAAAMTRSTLTAEITVNAAPQTYQIQHRCETAATNGFGVANGFEGDEIYTVCHISQA